MDQIIPNNKVPGFTVKKKRKTIPVKSIWSRSFFLFKKLIFSSSIFHHPSSTIATVASHQLNRYDYIKSNNGQDHHRHRRLQRYVRTFCAARLSNLTLRVGIGAAIADFLLNQSHNVVLIARTEKPLEELRERYPKQSLVLVGDLGDLSLPQKAVDKTVEKFGQLDGVIVNHGIMDPVTKIETSDIEKWKKNFDVNFFSSFAFVSIK